MRPDRPLIVSILFLAGGLTLMFIYGSSSSGMNAALPMASSTLRLDINATGPAALGGIALLIVGILFLLWSLIAAIVQQLMLLGGGSYRGPAKLLDYDTTGDESEAPAEYSGRRAGHTLLG
jgi:hypothetical protein